PPCRRDRSSVQQPRTAPRGFRAGERLPSREARIELVPELDALLAVLPAQPDVASFVLAEEVAQPDVEVLDRDADLFDRGQLFGERLHQPAKAGARVAQLVGSVAALQRLRARRLAQLLERLVGLAQLRADLHHRAE